MKATVFAIAMAGLVTVSASAQSPRITGTYVEARTAEVFAGGCIMNSEAGTAGREALLAWKIDHGRFNGVALDGMAIVAAVSADSNLGVHEIGGTAASTRTALFVDVRATATQRRALVAMAKALAVETVGTVVEEVAAPIEFTSGDNAVRVTTPLARLVVKKELDHSASCGNKQWFTPLAQTTQAEMGTAAENAFGGTSLGTRWSDPNKRSAFYGAFAR